MSPEPTRYSSDKFITRPAWPPGSKHPWPIVHLVGYDPGPLPGSDTRDVDSQCDCACLICEGQELPELRGPASFFLELTPACNNNCPGCGNVFAGCSADRADLPGERPLSRGQWDLVLDQIRPFTFRLKLTGGEPTLHPDFETLVEGIAVLDIPFTLFTNGRWPSPARLVDLLETIPTFEGMLVSWHGPTAADHEAFTNAPGSFDVTTANIRRAVEAGFQVSLSCIITRHNWQRVEQIARSARQMGATSVVFNRYLGRDVAGLAASRDELQTALRQLQALRAAGEPVKLGNCVPHCFSPAATKGCLAGTAFVTIDPWGRVRPCNHSPLLCGSLLQEPLADIWQGPALTTWRTSIPDQCKGCAALATCRAGCRAEALVHGTPGDPLLGAPLASTEESPRPEVVLFGDARPVSCFARRPEKFGSLLLAGNRLLPVDASLHPLLDLLDGRTTLRHIQAQHGDWGLAFVAGLYLEGMVELRS